MKTTGSSFENFYRDEFTTLPEVSDRIFSTSIALEYIVALPKDIELTIDNLTKIGEKIDFAKVRTSFPYHVRPSSVNSTNVQRHYPVDLYHHS